MVLFSTAAGIAQSIVTAPVSGLLTGVTRGSAYAGNQLTPNLLPDLRDLIECLLKGIITPANFEEIAQSQGLKDYRGWWNAVFDSKHPVPDINTLIRMKYRNSFSSDWTQNKQLFYNTVRRAGWWNEKIIDMVQTVPYQWTLEEIRKLRELGLIGRDEWYQFVKSAGMYRTDDLSYFNRLIKPPSNAEILQLLNRGEIGTDNANEWLILNGFTNKLARDCMLSLRHELPSPSNLVSFAVKEGWNKPIVDTYGYDQEFPPEFAYWMEKTGYGGNPNLPGVTPEQSGLTSWAQVFWREHWRNISPEQAYRMFWRFRPTGGENGGARNPNAGTFTEQDVANVLKINDYPPFFRNKLLQLSYNVLRLVDIRRIVNLSLRSDEFKKDAIGESFTIKQWAYENFLDRGQSPKDAEALATLAVEEGKNAKRRLHEKRTAFIRSRQLKVTQDEYRTGTIDRGQALLRLGESGLHQKDAESLVDVMDREFAVACAKSNVAMVKKLYVKGHATVEQCTKMLERSGINQSGIERYINCWSSTTNEADVLRETREVIAAFRDGILTDEVAKQLLRNLGWQNVDSMIDEDETYLLRQ